MPPSGGRWSCCGFRFRSMSGTSGAPAEAGPTSCLGKPFTLKPITSGKNADACEAIFANETGSVYAKR